MTLTVLRGCSSRYARPSDALLLPVLLTFGWVMLQIFDGVARRNFMSGLFLKDYAPTSW